MPQQITTSYQAKYSEDTIGIVAETVGGAILSGMSGSGFKGVMGVLGAGVEEGINQLSYRRVLNWRPPAHKQ